MRDLRRLAFEGNFCSFRLLCKEKGVNVNEAGPESGRTALHWGAFAGSNEIVSYLLNAKQAVVDPLDVELNTPLNLVIQAPLHSLPKKLAVIDTLLAHDADPTRKNKQGKTPLMNLIQVRDNLPASHYFQLKNINAIILKIKESIYQKALREGQTVRISPKGEVCAESIVYATTVSKNTYVPRQTPFPNIPLRRHF